MNRDFDEDAIIHNLHYSTMLFDMANNVYGLNPFE